MKLSGFLAVSLFIGLTTAGCAADPLTDTIAGLYSTRHKVTVEGRKVEIDGYLNIEPSGRITVYGFQDHGASLDGKDCYFPATGTAANSPLQNLILVPGQSPGGEPDYEVRVGEDIFGILTEPEKGTGKMRWFFHGGRRNNTVTIIGDENIVNSEGHAYSISGPRLTSPTLADIQTHSCGPGFLN